MSNGVTTFLITLVLDIFVCAGMRPVLRERPSSPESSSVPYGAIGMGADFPRVATDAKAYFSYREVIKRTQSVMTPAGMLYKASILEEFSLSLVSPCPKDSSVPPVSDRKWHDWRQAAKYMPRSRHVLPVPIQCFVGKRCSPMRKTSTHPRNLVLAVVLAWSGPALAQGPGSPDATQGHQRQGSPSSAQAVLWQDRSQRDAVDTGLAGPGECRPQGLPTFCC